MPSGAPGSGPASLTSASSTAGCRVENCPMVTYSAAWATMCLLDSTTSKLRRRPRIERPRRRVISSPENCHRADGAIPPGFPAPTATSAALPAEDVRTTRYISPIQQCN